jgi:hypothetical protein
VLAGRAFTSMGPGMAYSSLTVATLYSWLVLFALAGTMSVSSYSMVRASALA